MMRNCYIISTLQEEKGLRTDRLVKQLVVPKSLNHDILLSYHDSLLACHQGFDRTFHLIHLKYFWLRMYNEIKQYVTSCLNCQANKTDKHSRHKAPLKPLPCDGIFKRIHVDLFGPLPEVNHEWLQICSTRSRFIFEMA